MMTVLSMRETAKTFEPVPKKAQEQTNQKKPVEHHRHRTGTDAYAPKYAKTFTH
jgi:hypothetical protein